MNSLIQITVVKFTSNEKVVTLCGLLCRLPAPGRIGVLVAVHQFPYRSPFFGRAEGWTCGERGLRGAGAAGGGSGWPVTRWSGGTRS